MKILYAAYRDWAVHSFYRVAESLDREKHRVCLVNSLESFTQHASDDMWDAIVIVGWSWKVPAEVVNNKIVVGMHPSDLPAYAGGSPIQNQILDGVKKTNATLFKLNEQFDQGEIVDKEPISLEGHLSDVLSSISEATVNLVLRFVENWPNNTYSAQVGEKHVVRRLKPADSLLLNPSAYDSRGELKPMTCEEMWNHIRCREDPYPNAYFEDETGRLVIRHVEFIPK